MASLEGGNGGELDSLFEGMVLIESSDILLPSPSSLSPPLPQSNEVETASAASSLPLDEDLFSDLTILTPPPLDQHTVAPFPPPDVPFRNTRGIMADLSPSSTPETPPLLQPSRSIVRKKKKAIRIGYARDTSAANSVLEQYPSGPTSPSGSSVSTIEAVVDDNSQEKIEEIRDSSEIIHKEDGEKEDTIEEDTGQHAAGHVSEQSIPSISPLGSSASTEDAGGISNKIEEINDPSEIIPKEETTEEDPVAVVERKLDNIRAKISLKLSEIKQTVTDLVEVRKTLRRKRRDAVESVNAVTGKFKALERELEEACEVEDFERAEILSESLAATEKEKEDQLKLLRQTEEEFDALDLKMQEILNILISTEEESISLLETFSQEAGDSSEKIMIQASKVCSREMEEWQQSMETLESAKLQTEIESNIVNEASSGILNQIDHLTETDRREKEELTSKGAILERELHELEDLIKEKKLHIFENNKQIQLAEARISKIVSQFDESESTIMTKLRFLETSLSEMESKTHDLSRKKMEIEESAKVLEMKSLKLRELAESSIAEVMTCRNVIGSRKSMVTDFMKVREEKIRLAKMEEEKSEEVHMLHGLISAAKSSLQELLSTRARIQEEMTMLTQRMSFIDKKIPELESEKRAAAMARNFKEAARAASEAKTLIQERETAEHEKNQKVNDLEKVNQDIENISREMEEREELVLLREREAAAAGWERLCLVAATARAELAAADLVETEEGKILIEEAVSAESKARELRERYGFDLESVENTYRCLTLLPIIISLSPDASSLKKG